MHQLDVHGIDRKLIEDGRIGFGMDTLQIARKGIRDDKTGVGVPTAYNLRTLFQFVSGSLPSTPHRAMADLKATATVFRFPIFWDTRTECFFRLSIREEQQQQKDVQLLFLHLVNNWIMIRIRIRRTLRQANLVFVLFLLPLQQVQRMKISPVLFLWVTHGKKSVTFSLRIQIQHNGLRSISLLPVAANDDVWDCNVVT